MEFISVSLFASRRINHLVQNKNYLSLAQGWLKCPGASRLLSTPAPAVRNYSADQTSVSPSFLHLLKSCSSFKTQRLLNSSVSKGFLYLPELGRNILLLWSIRTNCCSLSFSVSNIEISILKRVLWLKSYLSHSVVVSYLPWPWVSSHW